MFSRVAIRAINRACGVTQRQRMLAMAVQDVTFSSNVKYVTMTPSFLVNKPTQFIHGFSTNTAHLREMRISDEFETKVALITGSTSGIGLGIAKSFASRGCNIILTGLGEMEYIEKLQEEFKRDYSVDSHYVYADLSEQSEIKEMCAKIHEIYPSGIDILVNNAGFQHVSPLEKFSSEKWEKMISVMLSAPFYLTKYLSPQMKEKGWGRIVNISSAHGVIASPNKAAYVSAKHGIVGLTKVTALELATYGVTCNALCPGFVNTPILQAQVKTLQADQDITYEEAEHIFLEKYHATKECVEVKQLADMMAFLCSNSAAQMTGSSIVMDGGWTAK